MLDCEDHRWIPRRFPRLVERPSPPNGRTSEMGLPAFPTKLIDLQTKSLPSTVLDIRLGTSAKARDLPKSEPPRSTVDRRGRLPAPLATTDEQQAAC